MAPRARRARCRHRPEQYRAPVRAVPSATPVEEVAPFAHVLEVTVGELYTPGGPTAAMKDLCASLQEIVVIEGRLFDAAFDYQGAQRALWMS